MTDQTNLPATVAAESPKPIANANLSKGGAIAALIPQSLDDTFRLAKALSSAGDMVPKHFQGKPEATMAAIVRGMEIGLAPMQALSNIAVINGRASLWGDALPALMQRHGHQLDSRVDGEGENMVATATLIRGDTAQRIERTFSVSDAKKAKLWSKEGAWQQYPSRMLQLRARTLACRDGAADALMGLQVAEEVSDYPKDITPKEQPQTPFQRKLAAARGEPIDPPADERSQDAIPDAEEVASEPVEKIDTAHWTDEDPNLGVPGSDAWDAGMKAFSDGKAASTCPHEEGTPEAADWLGGFYGARRAAE